LNLKRTKERANSRVSRFQSGKTASIPIFARFFRGTLANPRGKYRRRNAADSLFARGLHRSAHARFVNRIDALWRNPHLLQWQADRLRLPPQKLSPHAVHAHALESLRNCREQLGNTNILLLEQRV